MNLEIRQVNSPSQLELFRGLLREYAEWLKPTVWRGLERDIGDLPGKYAAPGGMWLGFVDGALAGCVALNPLNDQQIEIKRLFVRDAFRGRGYARAFARHAMAQASQRGYAQVVLQVERQNAPAIGLYRSLGFTEIPSYDKKLDQRDLFLGKECKMTNAKCKNADEAMTTQYPIPNTQYPIFEEAYDDARVSTVRGLLTEYARGQGLRPDNSNIYDDIAALPGRYSSPQGRLYLVKLGDENVGCGGLVPLKDGDCEMKRLYVRPAYRGRGIARALSQKLIDDARSIGYHRVTLSTKNEWPPALNLYLSMGFIDIAQVRFSKMNDLRWLGLTIDDGRQT